jgi:hypothetical protein
VRDLPVGVGSSPSTIFLDMPLTGLSDAAYRIQFAAADGRERVSEWLRFRVVP